MYKVEKCYDYPNECEEYGCPPIVKQWSNVVDMLLAQAMPKDHKKEEKFGKINGVRCVLKMGGMILIKYQ